jgi:hypothetical protein
MSTVKISQLPLIAAINANTSNTLFVGVDLTTGATGKLTAKTLAKGLYSNEVLDVGSNQQNLPNTVAQFAQSGASYVQTNLVNTDDGGSADIVVTANTGSGGTDSTYFIDMGFANKSYQPGFEFNNIGTAINPRDGYLYVQGLNGSNGGNLIVGTTTTNTNLRIIVGGGSASNIVARFTNTGLTLNTQSYLTFSDGTTQSTAAASNAYSQAAFGLANTLQGGLNTANANIAYILGVDLAQNTSISLLQGGLNTANANIAYILGVDLAQNTLISAANTLAQGAFDKANTSVQNTAVIQLQSLTLSGNLIANSVGQSISVDNLTSVTATFSKNLVVLGNLTANTLLGNIFFSNVTSITTQANSILWTQQAGTVTQQTGQLWYSSESQSLVLDTDTVNDRPSISKVLFFRCYNASGATIPANSVVRLTGGVTANLIPNVTLADASSAANATVAGFVVNPITTGAYGFAYSQGIVENLNAFGLGNSGDILFLSTTPGRTTTTAPIGGNSNTVVQIGRIISNSASQGKLFIQNQLRQAYGQTNGSVLYALANNITASNTLSINDGTGTVNANNIVANTVVFSSYTANAMVTQLTSKSTAVTANGISGQITMHNAALAGQAYVAFTVNNSYVKHVNDIPFVAVQNSVTTPNPYQVCVGGVSVGSFNIAVYNCDSGGGSSHSDAIVLNWGLLRVGN